MELNGLLLIDKEEGITSHDVVDKVRKVLETQKVGHAGTLDPFATGLLVIGVGSATRLLEYIMGSEKVYETEMELGKITDTFDITGTVVEIRDISGIFEQEILNAIFSFKGEYMQVPPAYSAKKYKGERLYELARQGKIINLPPKKATIYDIWDIDVSLPFVRFKTKVSAGTYIRSLCMDIGYKLGCGAVTTKLRRLSSGKFSVKTSVKSSELSKESLNLIPMEEILDFPKMYLKSEEKVYNGIQPTVFDVERYDTFKKDDLIQVFVEKKLVAIAVAERNSDFIETLNNHSINERIAKLVKVFKKTAEL